MLNDAPDSPADPRLSQQEQGDLLNLIDPKLRARALKRIQGLVKGNGVKAEDVKLESCEAVVYPFGARTFVRLAPKYGVRIEPGLNKTAELIATQEAFKTALNNTVTQTRTLPEKRQIISDFLFKRSDKGFGIKDQKTGFHALAQDFVMHEGCAICARKGKIGCQKCGGDGRIACPLCQSRKEITCPQCRGTGKVAHGNSHRPCERCHHTGRILCTNCSGNGYIKCPTCAAKGTLQCEKCAGTGWLSHLAHVEMEAHLHFDFDRQAVPLEVTRMIDAFGSRLVEKGDIEVVLSSAATTPDDIRRLSEPADMIFVDYDAKTPYGPIRFRIKDRVIPATLFGYQGRLIEAPAFLDDLTRKGQQVLAEAANGQGDIADKIRRAAKYRLLCDVIIQAAGKTRQRKAIEVLTMRYSTGISSDRLLALLLQADKALKIITRKPRRYGLALGLSLYGALAAGYFLWGRSWIGSLNAPDTALIGLDVLLVPIGMMMGVLSSQSFSMMAQKKALAGLVPPKVMASLVPKAGKIVWWSLAGAILVTTGLLGALWMVAPVGMPDWISAAMTQLLT
jgi:hypothetical protein